MKAVVDNWQLEPHVDHVVLKLKISKKKAATLPPLESLLDVTIEPHRERRSRNANNYCWSLCQRIAERIGSTQIDVYRAAVREVGPRESIRIRKEAATSFIRQWTSHGIGWQADVSGEDARCSYIMAYAGSSSYSTEEMSRLIDWLIDEATRAGVDVVTPEERAQMLAAWGER